MVIMYEWRVNQNRPWQSIKRMGAIALLRHYREDFTAILRRVDSGETVQCFVGYIRVKEDRLEEMEQ